MQPACIFLPSSAVEVAQTVSIMNKCDCEFAIRGGGHMNVSNCPSFSHRALSD